MLHLYKLLFVIELLVNVPKGPVNYFFEVREVRKNLSRFVALVGPWRLEVASYIRFEPRKYIVDKESGGDGYFIAFVNNLIKVKVYFIVGKKALKSLSTSAIGLGLFKLILRVFLSFLLL